MVMMGNSIWNFIFFTFSLSSVVAPKNKNDIPCEGIVVNSMLKRNDSFKTSTFSFMLLTTRSFVMIVGDSITEIVYTLVKRKALFYALWGV